MFTVISTLATSPITYIVLPLILSFLLKNGRVKKALYAISFVLLVLFTNQPLLKFAEEKWYAPFDKPLTVSKIYDYGVVLGGYSDWDWKRDRLECGSTADRLYEGIRLYKIGKIRKLVLASDGSIIQKKDGKGVQGNPVMMMAYLNEMGIPTEDVIMEKYARNTRENVTLTMELLGNKLHSDNMLLITSGVHMKRSLDGFNKEGLDPDCYITDTWPSLKDGSNNYWPSVGTLAQWPELLHEWIGYIVYKIIY